VEPTATPGIAISLMLAVSDAQEAADWYHRVVGAQKLWDLGSVIGLSIDGAPFFLGQPANNGWGTPEQVGLPTVRVELFVEDPDTVLERAAGAGATHVRPLKTHEMPWGPHRQGGFVDPFGHLWFVGDRSPLQQHVTD
jgi:PhnB protein